MQHFALILMTGRASKKGTKSGCSKNSKDKLEIWKELINNLGTEEVVKIFKELIGKGNKDLVEIIKKIPKEKTKLSSQKATAILVILKSSIGNLCNSNEVKTDNSKSNNERLMHMI